MMFKVILTVLCLISHRTLADSCISNCYCRDGTVSCANRGLRVIPFELPQGADVLDFRYNDINGLHQRQFANANSIRSLYLSDNKIVSIATNSFEDLDRLEHLELQNNRIQVLPDRVFKPLKSLKQLHLDHNELTALSSSCFGNMTNLHGLFLKNNKITHVDHKIFDLLPNLKRFRLINNPIKCNCEILEIIQILRLRSPHLQSEVFCTKHNGRSSENLIYIRDLEKFSKENKLNCYKPNLLNDLSDMILTPGESVSLNCEADGKPKPNYVWYHNDRIIDSNHNNLIISDKQYGEGAYKCVAFNPLGNVSSNSITVSIEFPNHKMVQRKIQSNRNLEFSVTPSDTNIIEGEDATIKCMAKSDSSIEIKWFFENEEIQGQSHNIFVHRDGTMKIHQATENNNGYYKCIVVSKQYGDISKTIKVHVTSSNNRLPIFEVISEDQTVSIGSEVTLYCISEGSTISWTKNEHPLITSQRIILSDDNTELMITDVRISDDGTYNCMAQNSDGKSTANVKVTVEQNYEAPTFESEPFDMSVITGTTIEIPCQGKGSPKPQVRWRKDGKTLTERYITSPTGSLIIREVIATDTGRYECTILNEFGRATAHALLTVQDNEVLAPGDRYIRVAFAEATREIDAAINSTIASLFHVEKGKKMYNLKDLFHSIRYPNPTARELARSSEIFERTLVNIRKYIDAGEMFAGKRSENFNYTEILSPEQLDLLAQLSGCSSHRVRPNCTDMCFHAKYRTIDGTCNNLQNPTQGGSLTGFRRMIKPMYENDLSMPIGWNKDKLYFGYPKPSARLVSSKLIKTEQVTPDDEITHMVMQWGQFLDHDLDHSLPSVTSESWDGIDCKKSCAYAAPCYPIDVPSGDKRITNRRCIDFVRTSAVCGSGMTSVFFDQFQPREQINQLTSYLDASQVYGYSAELARDLRNLTTEEGLMRYNILQADQKQMLPFMAPTDGMDCRRDNAESNINCFSAGDIRVNEQVGLTAMHTIWMREHNRIASILHQYNQQWDGDKIYEETRKIVGAEMQHITYKHWLPLIVGDEGMQMLGDYQGYDPTVDASISNEFATAALRFGHTLINPILTRLNTSFEVIEQGNLMLHKAFFAPWRVVHEGGVDPLMRGMFMRAAKLKKPTENLNIELTEKLFLTAHAVALDLAAINIQRGRDHGIPGYNDYRKICNLPYANTFDDLRHEITSQDVRHKLKELYGHPSNIDLFVGGILEDQVPGGKIGPVFRCILVDQFKRLRDGDRFYYENPAVFKSEQLSQIKTTSLSRILCDNGDNITRITTDVFKLPERQGGIVDCNRIPKIDLQPWIDCGTCGAHLNRLLYTNVPQLLTQNQLRRRFRRNTDGNIEIGRIIEMEAKISSFQKTIEQMEQKILKLEEKCFK